MDILSGPKRTETFQGSSEAFVAEKALFGSYRGSAGSDNRCGRLGEPDLEESMIEGISRQLPFTSLRIATFRPGVQAWKRSYNCVLSRCS
jgi:hypothetical protein